MTLKRDKRHTDTGTPEKSEKPDTVLATVFSGKAKGNKQQTPACNVLGLHFLIVFLLLR